MSTDGGARWRPARLQEPSRPRAWVRWEFPSQEPDPGRYDLLARATDGEDFDDDQLWAVVSHPVRVV